MEPNWVSIVELGWKHADDETALIDYFTEVEQRYPASARAKFELANALDYLSRESEAIPLYEEAIRMGIPSEYHAYALLQLGSSLRNVGRISEAVEMLSEAEKTSPVLPSISMFLGLALCSAGRPNEALSTVMNAMLKHVHTDDLDRYRWGLKNYIQDINP